MDLTDIKTLKSLLAKHGATPKKHWGQNFLVSKKVLGEILAAADIKKTDRILEIGGGAGTLTRELAKRAREVTVIEKDLNLIPVLTDALSGFKNVTIVQGDALKLSALPYGARKCAWRIIANIPYWITGRLLRLALETKNPPRDIILTIQKEVAERICASPPHMNLLAASVQYYGAPKIVDAAITPNNFWPPSGVNSALTKIAVAGRRADQEKNDAYFRVLRAGFAHPRKQLRPSLKKTFGLNDKTIDGVFGRCGLAHTLRAQELSVENWECLRREIMI